MSEREPGSATTTHRRRWMVPALVYALLVVVSHLFAPRASVVGVPSDVVESYSEVPATVDQGSARRGTVAIHSLQTLSAKQEPSLAPVVLIHGSPGSARDFGRILPLLSEQGSREVIALDVPGFGESRGDVPRMSLSAAALSLQSFLEAKKIERAHIVGWSNGGGIALHLADLAPERVASLTLMGSIGRQENEGSGDYYFEHAKYALGIALFGGVPELVPHFGWLGTFHTRTAWLRQFWESDQRPLEGVMKRISDRGTPTLILHGRRDVLVPYFAAEDHHNRIASSKLVMINANHFIPFTHPKEAAAILVPFFQRHDVAGVAAEVGYDNRAPRPDAVGMDRWIRAFEVVVRDAPWWQEVTTVALLAIVSPGWTVVLAGLLIVGIDLDPFVVAFGVILGMCAKQGVGFVVGWRLGRQPSRDGWPWRRVPLLSAEDFRARLAKRPVFTAWQWQFVPGRRVWSAMGMGAAVASARRAGAERRERHARSRALLFVLVRVVAIVAFAVVSVIAVVAAESLVVGKIRQTLGTLGVAYTLIKLIILADAAPMFLARRGRQELFAFVRRIIHHEYWPTWILYIPIVIHNFVVGLRHGGFMTPSCCNPEFGKCGGMAGESKAHIFEFLARNGDPRVMAISLVPAGGTPESRANRTIELIRTRNELGGYPVVLKPDQGERGHAVKIARDAGDVREYFATMTADAIVQRYHAGPLECGVMWVRKAGEERLPLVGEVFAITDKVFPFVTGDGRHTLEDLIWSHPRYRRQVKVFMARFQGELSRVPTKGERVQLAQSGNHCQGVMFQDGERLRSAGLEEAIDSIARQFPRLDVGRFDVRYESEEGLRRGEFAIVELNGTASEPTNIYDPRHTVLWAYGVMFRLWKRLYQLGEARRREGVAVSNVRTLLRETRQHFASLRGSAISD